METFYKSLKKSYSLKDKISSLVVLKQSDASNIEIPCVIYNLSTYL